MKIGENLKKLRKIRGLTQEEVAHELEISQSAYSKIENNSASISIEKMLKLSKILNITLEKLLELDIEKYVNNSEPVKPPLIDDFMLSLRKMYETRIIHLEEEVLFLRDELKSKRESNR